MIHILPDEIRPVQRTCIVCGESITSRSRTLEYCQKPACQAAKRDAARERDQRYKAKCRTKGASACS